MRHSAVLNGAGVTSTCWLGSPAAWLAVESNGNRYLLPLVQSGEIFPWSAVQTVPYTKPWYMGVANLRGGLHGVIDLAGLLRQGSMVVPKAADRVTSDSRLVSLHAALGLKREVLALLEEDQPRIAQVIKYQEQQLTASAL